MVILCEATTIMWFHLQDQEINRLQRQLKESEDILATALFQAKQKLASILTANKRPISSEELIKYAYRLVPWFIYGNNLIHKFDFIYICFSISASNAICAPLTWQQGDLRRPYPTDIEMRLGFLGKSDLNFNGHNLQHQSSVSSDIHRSTTGGIYKSICMPRTGVLLIEINSRFRYTVYSAKSVCMAAFRWITYDC